MCRSTLDFTCNKVNVYRILRVSRVGSVLGRMRMAANFLVLDLVEAAYNFVK